MTQIKDIFCKILQAFTPDVFKRLRTIKVNHLLEEEYSMIINNVLDANNMNYTRNLTTYPDYVFDDGQLLEIKATRTRQIKLNDTVPHKDVNYILINLTLEQVILKSGDEMLSDEDRQKLIDSKEAIKKHRISGRLSSYPRVNMSLKIDWD